MALVFHALTFVFLIQIAEGRAGVGRIAVILQDAV